ncbi:MAG: O-antigen ligase family protein [Planctomycetota bacterium]
MSLEFRYVMAIATGIIMISVAMIAIRNIEDFLVCAVVFNIPFSIFAKWFFVNRPVAFPVRGISVGLIELLILLAYSVWFYQVFVIRKNPLPRLDNLDYFIIFLIFVQLVSLIRAPDKYQGVLDIIYNIKHALIYFFFAHNVRRQHLKIIILCILFAILLESTVAVYERTTGNVGIGVWKGNVSYYEFGRQYTVPGLEGEIRSAGTTLDPHALGLYYAMILPVPFVLLIARFPSPPLKILLAAVLVTGVGGLVLTFSRSGWLSFAISLALATAIIIFLWRRVSVILVAAFIILFVTLFFPQTYGILHKRIFDAPRELIEVRIETAKAAFDVWRHNFFFGYGPGSYLDAINDPDFKTAGHHGRMAERPVHNAYLWTAAELGLCGLIAFWSIVIIAIAKCAKMLRHADPMIRGLALAVLAGLVAYMVDSMTNMMFREATPYAQLWVYLALAVAFKRLAGEPTLTQISPAM